MINTDIIIKIERQRGHKYDWPEQTREMIKRLNELKLGFPGLGNDHLSLVPFEQIKQGDWFIWDEYIESKKRGDSAPMMLNWIEPGKARIEGIGCGLDLKRDPDRIRYRWMDIIDLPELKEGQLVVRVDVRPTLNGGPGYYYFYKSYRDFRY
jgi:hypothetical protein